MAAEEVDFVSYLGIPGSVVWGKGRLMVLFLFGGGGSCPRLVCQQLLIRDTVPHLLAFRGPGSFLW